MKMNLCENFLHKAHLTSIFSIFVILALINSQNSRDGNYFFRRKWIHSYIKILKFFLPMIQCSLFAVEGQAKVEVRDLRTA